MVLFDILDFSSINKQLQVPDAALWEEEKRRCSVGDSLHRLFVVAAEKACQQVVEDTDQAHQQQEEQDTLSKQVAWSALGGLPHVADKVLLPNKKVDETSKGGWGLVETETSAPHHCQKRWVGVHAVAVCTGHALNCSSVSVMRCALLFYSKGKEDVLKYAQEGDYRQKVNVFHKVIGVHDHEEQLEAVEASNRRLLFPVHCKTQS